MKLMAGSRKALLQGELTDFSYGTMVAMVCVITFASYLGSYMRLPVVPLFALTLGASTAQVGLINATFFLMAGLLSLPLGVFSDRLGRKSLTVSGLALSSATAALLYFSQTPMQLVGIYFFFGISLAAVGPTLMSYMAELSPATHLGRSFGWYTTAVYGAMSLGPALGGFVAQEWGFRPLFLLAAAFLFVVVWLAMWCLPPKVTLPGPKAAKAATRSQLSQLSELLRKPALLGCWLAALVSCFGLGMFITFFPLYGHQQGLTLGQIGIIFTVQGGVNVLSRLPFGRLSDRVGRRASLATLGLIALAITFASFGLAREMTAFILCAVALGFSMGLYFTSLMALTAEIVPPDARGLAMGGYSACLYLGQMLSSAVMGGVISALGFGNCFLLSGLVTLLGAGFFHCLVKASPAGRGF